MKFKGMSLPEILKIRQINQPNNRVNRKSLQTLRGKKNLVGVEIGVSAGDNAFDMLVKLDIDTLYLVDPYSSFKQWTQERLDEHLELAQGLLENFKNKIIWLRQPSLEAVLEIEDNLDFVYVDGDHSYRGCLDDLQTYWPKIKSGGLLCGDNWEVTAVRSAIKNFALIIDQIYYYEQNIDVNSVDFWFTKD
jgi:predicted O-methyltransferase YrrM